MERGREGERDREIGSEGERERGGEGERGRGREGEGERVFSYIFTLGLVTKTAPFLCK